MTVEKGDNPIEALRLSIYSCKYKRSCANSTP